MTHTGMASGRVATGAVGAARMHGAHVKYELPARTSGDVKQHRMQCSRSVMAEKCAPSPPARVVCDCQLGAPRIGFAVAAAAARTRFVGRRPVPRVLRPSQGVRRAAAQTHTRQDTHPYTAFIYIYIITN